MLVVRGRNIAHAHPTRLTDIGSSQQLRGGGNSLSSQVYRTADVSVLSKSFSDQNSVNQKAMLAGIVYLWITVSSWTAETCATIRDLRETNTPTIMEDPATDVFL